MTSKNTIDRSARIEFRIWEAENLKKFVRPQLEKQIDASGVPEDKRGAEFEKELVQLRMGLYRDSLSYKWLFHVALHEGAHLWYMRKTGQECTMAGPRIQYNDEGFHIAYGTIWTRSKLEYTYEYTMETIKEYLAGPLAVTMLTGVKADAEPDILAACKFLEMPREKVEEYLWLAEPELEEELRTPEVIQEILDAAREYANAIFRNDFCIEWGIKRYQVSSLFTEKTV